MTATQPLTETTVLANDVKMPTIGFGTWQIPINENFDSTIQTAIQLATASSTPHRFTTTPSVWAKRSAHQMFRALNFS